MSEGIDQRILDAGLPYTPPASARDRRQAGPGGDASASAWPPPSNGPLPPPDSLPPDLNIFTAQDEIDAWAHEHDQATEETARLRVELNGDPTRGVEGAAVRYYRERAQARRQARASPTERGRRTAQDIDEEVNEALIASGAMQEKLRLESAIDNALARLFRAKENVARLDSYVRSLPRVDDRG